jgi:hypothetical protein
MTSLSHRSAATTRITTNQDNFTPPAYFPKSNDSPSCLFPPSSLQHPFLFWLTPDGIRARRFPIDTHHFIRLSLFSPYSRCVWGALDQTEPCVPRPRAVPLVPSCRVRVSLSKRGRMEFRHTVDLTNVWSTLQSCILSLSEKFMLITLFVT